MGVKLLISQLEKRIEPIFPTFSEKCSRENINHAIKNKKTVSMGYKQISTKSGLTKNAGEEATMLLPQELFQNMGLLDRNTQNY